jgi:hypothetical protein
MHACMLLAIAIAIAIAIAGEEGCKSRGIKMK